LLLFPIFVIVNATFCLSLSSKFFVLKSKNQRFIRIEYFKEYKIIKNCANRRICGFEKRIEGEFIAGPSSSFTFIFSAINLEVSVKSEVSLIFQQSISHQQ
jgi:hypothetical protein